MNFRALTVFRRHTVPIEKRDTVREEGGKTAARDLLGELQLKVKVRGLQDLRRGGHEICNGDE